MGLKVNINFHKISKRVLIGGAAGLILATVAMAGMKFSLAATPTLRVSPTSGNISRGTVFDMEVRAYSETALNAVQANLFYDGSNLEVVGISYEGSAYNIEAENVYGNGQIKIARGAFTPVKGDNLVATVSFKVLSSARGNTKVQFMNGSALVTAADSRNILGSVTNGMYKVR